MRPIPIFSVTVFSSWVKSSPLVKSNLKLYFYFEFREVNPQILQMTKIKKVVKILSNNNKNPSNWILKL